MNIELISMTDNAIELMYRAGRTCYSPDTPTEMWNKLIGRTDYNEAFVEKMWSLVKTILSSGHDSIAEHVYMTFACEGFTRATLAQITRHRHCSFSVQSQRYVEIKETKKHIMEVLDHHETNEMKELCDKYFSTTSMVEVDMCLKALLNYRTLIENYNYKPEDARKMLLNCSKTNMVFSMNLRELMHICHLRLCKRAQKEVRDMVGLMVKELLRVEPHFKMLLVPKCIATGSCNEKDSCGMMGAKNA